MKVLTDFILWNTKGRLFKYPFHFSVNKKY